MWPTFQKTSTETREGPRGFLVKSCVIYVCKKRTSNSFGLRWTSSTLWVVMQHLLISGWWSKPLFLFFCFLFPYLFCFPNTFIALYLFLDSDTRYQCVTLGGSKGIAWYLFIQTPPHISSRLHKKHWHSGTTLWHQSCFCNLRGFRTYIIHYCSMAVWSCITSYQLRFVLSWLLNFQFWGMGYWRSNKPPMVRQWFPF